MQPLLSAAEVVFSLVGKMFDQVTAQAKAAACRICYIGHGIWRWHMLCLKCQVPGCDSDKIGTERCQHPSVGCKSLPMLKGPERGLLKGMSARGD